MTLGRIVGWAAALAVIAAAWNLYRQPEFLLEWMSLLSACFA